MVALAVLEVDLGEHAGFTIGADLVRGVHAPPHHVGDVEVDSDGAGADLLQVWTGLVYRGPGLIGEATRAAVQAEQRVRADTISA